MFHASVTCLFPVAALACCVVDFATLFLRLETEICAVVMQARMACILQIEALALCIALLAACLGLEGTGATAFFLIRLTTWRHARTRIAHWYIAFQEVTYTIFLK
jgi:hypothetical protein